MLKNRKIVKFTDHLAQLLPWGILVAPGIIFNKDGSLQVTISIRGPDLEAVTKEQLITAHERLNDALKRLGSGWVIYVEARRQSCAVKSSGHFPDALSLMIEKERDDFFTKQGASFISKFYLTLQFLPSEKRKFSRRSLSCATFEVDDKTIDYFKTATQRFFDIIKNVFIETRYLNDEETLTYLHDAVSVKSHQVIPPVASMGIDEFIFDTPVVNGFPLQLGSKFLRVISILAFPASTLPAILEKLDHLPFAYRWTTRFIPLSSEAAKKELLRYRRYWFSKRKGMMQILQEIFTKRESILSDTSVLAKTQDADLALRELGDDQVSYGYYTTTVTVMDDDLAHAEAMQREVERVINSLGFTSINETFNALEAWLSSLPGQCQANKRASLLHSLNLAHLLPFSQVWSGPDCDEHLKAPPLMHVHTHGYTPFRLVNHIGDVGHQMIIGPTGSGKSVLLTMLALQFLRYRNAQVFVFDKGESFLAATLGVGGEFFNLGVNTNSCFQPLAKINLIEERVWATEWLLNLLLNEAVTITSQMKQNIWEALGAFSTMPLKERTLTKWCASIEDYRLRQAFFSYTQEGALGYLFNASEEIFSNSIWQCYEMENLMNERPHVVAPILSYLFHRLESHFNGAPTLLILDEAWIFLDHPMFKAQIRNWLKNLRKRNVSVIFATQSAEDVLATDIAATLLESCPTRVFLPNDHVMEPKIRTSYEKLGLNDRQIEILASALPKQQYYYTSSIGSRLFDLTLGPIAQAFCAVNRKEDREKIKKIFNEYGRDEFLKHYLSDKFNE